MDSRTSQTIVDAETDAFGMEPQHAGEFDEPGKTLNLSQEKATADAESGSVAAQANEKPESIQGPKGIRFALLFTCILLGSFFIGYVSTGMSQEICPS